MASIAALVLLVAFTHKLLFGRGHSTANLCDACSDMEIENKVCQVAELDECRNILLLEWLFLLIECICEVANFIASWSNPCKDIAPTYAKLVDKYSSLLFLTVDVDFLAVSSLYLFS
ncbi:hypothetical protein K1719_034152 [Acacia pycnantha]|nr:hypothetical protein K1719_034152 [Acacia pycnantha]